MQFPGREYIGNPVPGRPEPLQERETVHIREIIFGDNDTKLIRFQPIKSFPSGT
jgi:hypothetical protein